MGAQEPHPVPLSPTVDFRRMPPIMDFQDSDLFEPSLSEDHDAHSFGRPGEPRQLPFIAFFAGPIGAGYLVWHNFKQLGMAQHATRWLWGFVGITLACGGFAVYVHKQEMANSTSRLTTQALCIAAALWAAKQQATRFRVFEVRDGAPAPWLKRGLIAVVLGWATYLGVLMILLFLAGVE